MNECCSACSAIFTTLTVPGIDMRLHHRCAIVDFVCGNWSSRATRLLVIFLVSTFFIYDCVADSPVPLDTKDLQEVLNTTAVSFDHETGDYVFDGDYNGVHMILQCDDDLLLMSFIFKDDEDQGYARFCSFHVTYMLCLAWK